MLPLHCYIETGKTVMDTVHLRPNIWTNPTQITGKLHLRIRRLLNKLSID